jgi:hypothetical protein
MSHEMIRIKRLRVVPSTHLALRMDGTGSTHSSRLDSLMEYVESFLERRRELWPDIRRPIVYDIDDTLVYRTTSGADVPIARVVECYNRFVNHFPTYIVTARERDEGQTAAMLRQNGIQGFTALFMRRVNEDPGVFKWRTRCAIARLHDGWHPQMAVGDQRWDVLPLHALDTLEVKLSSRGSIVLHPMAHGELGVYLPKRRS